MSTVANFPEIMSLDDWVDYFKPKDALEPDDSDMVYAGQTQGPDEVRARTSPKANVWTIVSDDYDNHAIVEGYHYVNRVSYIVTEVARTSSLAFLIPVNYDLDESVYSINVVDGDEDDREFTTATSEASAKADGASHFGVEEDEIEVVLVSPSLNEQAGKPARVHLKP